MKIQSITAGGGSQSSAGAAAVCADDPWDHRWCVGCDCDGEYWRWGEEKDREDPGESQVAAGVRVEAFAPRSIAKVGGLKPQRSAHSPATTTPFGEPAALISAASPRGYIANGVARGNGKSAQVRVEGYDVDEFSIASFTLVEGHDFHSGDVRRAASVCTVNRGIGLLSSTDNPAAASAVTWRSTVRPARLSAWSGREMPRSRPGAHARICPVYDATEAPRPRRAR